MLLNLLHTRTAQMHAREPVDWKVLQLTKEKITLKMYSFSRSQFTYLKMPAPQVMDEY